MTADREHRIPARVLWAPHLGGGAPQPALPCDALGCALTAITTPDGAWLYVQHGANPEAIYHIRRDTPLSTAAWLQDVRERLVTWVQVVHRYEARRGAAST